MRLISLELPLSQQGMDFAVSENANLLICECALHSIRVVSEILVCDLVILLGKRGRLLAREVLKLKALEVFLNKTGRLESIFVTSDTETHQSYSWDLHGGPVLMEEDWSWSREDATMPVILPSLSIPP